MSNPIIINDNRFWEWMSIDQKKSFGINKKIQLILKMMRGNSHVPHLFLSMANNKASETINNLSSCVPRQYFSEKLYCLQAYGSIFGRIFPDLINHLDQLAYIEWLLYTEPGYLRYRDHIVHMFKVAFVCSEITKNENFLSKIVRYQFNSSHFRAWCVKQEIDILNLNHDQNEIIKVALFLGSIFHDFGYGYYFKSIYKKRLSKIYGWLFPDSDPTDTNSRATKTLLNSLSAEFLNEYHEWLKNNNSNNADKIISGFFRDNLPLNHSIASTFFIIDMAETLRNHGVLSDSLYIAFHLAAEACMTHDMTNDKNWLYLKRKSNGHFFDCDDCNEVPLSLLLIIADELSVWGRRRVKYKLEGFDKVICQLPDGRRDSEKIEIGISENKGKNEIHVSHNNQKENVCEDLKKLRFLKKHIDDKKRSFMGYNLIF